MADQGEPTNEVDSEEEIETMVIELGHHIIKAAFAGEKTCRYVSDNTKFNEDATGICLVSSNESDNSVAVVDYQRGVVNSENALVLLLKKCWTEQYECLSNPDMSRLLVIMSHLHRILLEKIAEIVFSRLHVKSLAVVSHGEAVSVYQCLSIYNGTCITLDIGVSESRIEAFVEWKLVESEYSFKGGNDVSKSLSDRLQSDGHSLTAGDIESIKTSMLYDNSDNNYTTNEGQEIEIKPIYKECVDILFQSDEKSNSIPIAISRILEIHHEISNIIVSGATSILLSQEKLERYLNLNRTIKFSLCPERNKVAWLGGSVIGSNYPFNHRFYPRDEFVSKACNYNQLIQKSDIS